MALILMVSFVGIPVIIIAEGNQNATYFISAAVIFTICCSILILMYVPKYVVLKQKKPMKQPFYSKTSSAPSCDDDEGIKILWSPQVQTDLEEKIKALTKENEHQKAVIQSLHKQTCKSNGLGSDKDDESFDFDHEGDIEAKE